MTVIPLPRSHAPSCQGSLALDLAPYLEVPEAVENPPTAPDGSPGDEPGPIEPWAHKVAQAAVEIVGGQRPASQLVRWLTPEVYRDLPRRALLVSQAAGTEPGQRQRGAIRPLVRSVHACHLEAGVVECSVRISYGERSRALALRFETHRDRWVCTAFDWS